MFLAGFIAGAIVGFMLGVILMGLMVVASDADKRLGEKGEADSEFVATVAIYLVFVLILLALWSLSGWELPL